MSQDIIYFDIIENTVSKDHPYRGIISHSETVNNADLIDEIAKCNTTITRQDALVVLDLYEDLIRKHLAQGHTVTTGIYRADLSLQGSFEHKGESFNKKKHRAKIVIRPAKKLSDRLTRGLRFHKARHPRVTGAMDQVFRPGGKDPSGTVQTGALMEIHGRGLRSYNYENSYELYLIDKEEKKTLLKVLKASVNRILVMVPESVKPGNYRLELIHSYGSVKRMIHYAGITVLQGE